jgi:hypothetical protein
MEGFLPRLLVPERLDFDVLVPARIACPRRAKAEMRRSKVMEYALNLRSARLSTVMECLPRSPKDDPTGSFPSLNCAAVSAARQGRPGFRARDRAATGWLAVDLLFHNS